MARQTVGVEDARVGGEDFAGGAAGLEFGLAGGERLARRARGRRDAAASAGRRRACA